MSFESHSNGFLRAWLSQNFPLGLVLLNEWVVAGVITELFLVTGLWIIRLESPENSRKVRVEPIDKASIEPELEIRSASEGPPLFSRSKPIYETVEIRTFIIIVMLATQAVSLWFITASTFRITIFTANSFYYYSHLPFTYWWGLAATLALFFTRSILRGRTQIG